LALLLGGAIGNFVDRVHTGLVVDFLDWHYRDRFRWPTFNVADIGITVGVGLLLLEMLRTRPRTQAAERQGVAEGTEREADADPAEPGATAQ